MSMLKAVVEIGLTFIWLRIFSRGIHGIHLLHVQLGNLHVVFLLLLQGIPHYWKYYIYIYFFSRGLQQMQGNHLVTVCKNKSRVDIMPCPLKLVGIACRVCRIWTNKTTSSPG